MSYLLDTNIVGELRKGTRCNPVVMDWYRHYAIETSFISVMTLGEIRKGVESSRRKDLAKAHVLERWLKELELSFEERILPISAEIADIWGRFVHRGDVAAIDGLIAATAALYGLTVATRNTRDFQRCGIDYINPFEA
jgi:predicted nucleic acid-binding protein